MHFVYFEDIKDLKKEKTISNGRETIGPLL